MKGRAVRPTRKLDPPWAPLKVQGATPGTRPLPAGRHA